MNYSPSEFETLYTRCFPASMRLAMSLLHEEDEARDVVHEVFLKLWESDETIGNPTAFILRAVRNACLSRLRSPDTREKIHRRLSLEPPPDDFDPGQHSEEISAAISTLLTPRQQQVIAKIYSEGLSYRATADSLGVSVAAVNKYLVGALKKLRDHFKS